jgi:serine/threonine-protein kinase
MEYLEGKNLNQVVRKEGPLPVERAIPVLIQVCGALQEAHLQGIIHRDLKPENIFLSTNGGLKDYPKVLDFGLAKVTERELRPGSVMLTQEGMVFGTPEFMSPEQAQGKPLDPRSDIYSLAVILYEVLTGKLPFDARTPMEYIQMHVTRPPIPLDERIPGKRFPRGLSDVLNKALEKNPDDRYASAVDFANALKPFAGLQGKGFTAMMPKGTAEALIQQAQEQQAAAPAPAPAPAPVAEVRNSPAVSPAPAPAQPSPSSPRSPRVKESAQAAVAPPSSKRAAPVAPVRRRPPQPSTLVMVLIAVACLIAGILITVAALRFFG